MMKSRKCLHCQEPYHGRIDKKFCDTACRSAYYYSRQRIDYHTFRQINAVLRKNRSILANLSTQMKGAKHIDKIYLEMQGFQFRYFTHEENQGKKECVRYCYDMGYLAVADSKVELVTVSKLKSFST
ncbi:MAG: hypothetical protein ACI84C_001854 [Flavobacteriales bacterium]|jgi:hypothetical protein